MKLTAEAQKKINAYLDFLRQLLSEHGHPPEEVAKINDAKLIDCFRFCHCCNEQLFTLQEQMWLVLEFDTPERAFKVLADTLQVIPHLPVKPPIQAEHVEADLPPHVDLLRNEPEYDYEYHDEEDDCEEHASCGESCFICDDASCSVCEEQDSEHEDDDVCSLCDEDLVTQEDVENRLCPSCYDEVMNCDDEEESVTTVIRGKSIMDGAPTLDQAIEKVADFLDRLIALKAQGYELSETVADDYAHLEQIHKNDSSEKNNN